MYGYLVPGYTLPSPKTTPMHEVLTDILKKMNYPGTVSKSHFQTLGGPSWGNILGVLHFFLHTAKTIASLFTAEAFANYNLQDEDADGFTIETEPSKRSKAEIEYHFWTKTYAKYQQGHDDFPEEREDLFWDLMDAKNIDEEAIGQRERLLEQLQITNKELKEDTGDIENLEDQSAKILSDIKGLQEYLEKQQTYSTQKRIDLKATLDNVGILNKKLENLRGSITILEADCRAKSIDPKDDSTHAEKSVMAIQARVESRKADVHEIDKMKWQKEQEISKKKAALDQRKRDFNRLLISLDISEEESKALKKAEANERPTMLNDLNNRLKNDVNKLKKHVEDLKLSLNRCISEIDKKSKEMAKFQSEENKAVAEKGRLLDDIKQEQEELTYKLKQVRDKLESKSRNKHQLGHDLKEKEVQLEIAIAEKRDLEKELEGVKKDGRETLMHIMREMEKDKKEELKKRDAAFEEYHQYSNKLSEVLREESAKMKTKLKKMKEELKEKKQNQS